MFIYLLAGQDLDAIRSDVAYFLNLLLQLLEVELVLTISFTVLVDLTCFKSRFELSLTVYCILETDPIVFHVRS